MLKLFVLLLLTPFFALGQSIISTEVSGQSNIYNDAVKRYVKYLSQKGDVTIDTLYIDSNHTVIGDSLNSRAGRIPIKVIDGEGLGVMLDNGGSLLIHYLFPLSFQEGQFYIPILPLGAKKVNQENFLVNSGIVRVYYSYDTKGKQFKFSKVQSFGI